MAPNRLLYIAYFFPPEAGGGGALRAVKYIKYLRRKGWEVDVLTVKRRDTFMGDSSLMQEIEGVEVYRAPDLVRGVVRSWLMTLAALKEKILPAKKAGTSKKSGAKTSGQAKKDSLASKVLNLAFRMLRDIICIPDECFGWIIPAYLLGKKVIKKNRPDVILSTSPPFASHMVGRKLSKAFKIPLVVDFRDRWAMSPAYKSYFGWRDVVNAKLEGAVIKHARAITATTPAQAEHFSLSYGEGAEGKTHVIWNGFDNDDYSSIEKIRPAGNKMTISHVGKLIGARSLLPLLQAMEALDENVLNDINLKMIGMLSPLNKELISRAPWASIITDMGAMAHLDALREMFSTEVLLIVQFKEDDGMRAVPSKVFEYMRAARPILAICPRGSQVWKLIEDNDFGLCADTEDVPAIKEALIEMHTRWKKDFKATDKSRREEFNIEVQTEALIKILDKAKATVKDDRPE